MNKQEERCEQRHSASCYCKWLVCDALYAMMSVATLICGGADVFGHVGCLVVCKSVNYTLLLNTFD